MTEDHQEFQLPPGLVNLPPEILERARRALPEGAGIEELTALVVEALGKYLDQEETRPATPWAKSAPPGNLLLSYASPTTAPSRARKLATQESAPTGRFRLSQEQAAPSLIEGIEGPSREVFLRSFEQIDGFENSLARAGSETAARGVLDQVKGWAGIERVRGRPVELDGEVREPKQQKPIFGFHNRDFPSLWSLELLAEATREGPVLWSEFAFGLNQVARKLGGLLRQLDRVPIGGGQPPRGLRFATSFPDPSKPNESGGGQWLLSPAGKRRERLFPFVKNNFARIQKSSGKTEAVGPLPQWQAVAFFPDGKDYRVGVTERGFELLGVTEGASIDLPHSSSSAIGFMGFIRQHAPEDWEGFRRVLRAVAEHPDRDELVLRNKEFFDSFREKPTEPEDTRFASTMNQGYVSRGREWGLVDPELAPSKKGRRVLYQLTELGEQLISSNEWA